MHLAIAGMQPFTSIDFPGKLAAVAFCRGCNWRCGYCHNRHLQPTAADNDWLQLATFLQQRRGLLDAIVFSGGEPLLQSGLGTALARCRGMGFATGLHTAGTSPQRFARLLPQLDWVGFDVKTSFSNYADITGIPGSGDKARASLEHLLDSSVAYEVRTTVDPQWLDHDQLWILAQELKALGVSRFVLQRCRSEASAVKPDPLTDKGLVQEISALFDDFELRI
ncbi:Ribonucleotide reductase of class III (anaerobic), activating protein [hydrothermal vent metagenome]|uniref:Ribonucleotide reductase of class III (Anaerobic), activating protein n=1 Tax=hydrothermal vent metagenome TaxID=652676 RepID=A0A3B1B7R8_9ZZZZ